MPRFITAARGRVRHRIALEPIYIGIHESVDFAPYGTINRRYASDGT